MHPPRVVVLFLLPLMALSLVAAACGGSDDPAASTGDVPTTTTSAAPTVAPTTGDDDGDSGDAPLATLPDPAAPRPAPLHEGPPVNLVPEVLASYPHDVGGFTQGLEFDERGNLYESTGFDSELPSTTTSLRLLTLDADAPVEILDLGTDVFGEGLTVLDDTLLQITWTSGQAFVYDRDTFERLNTFSYEGQGWGICDDGDRLVMSDGSSILTFRDRTTFAVLGQVAVTSNGVPVERINELECVGGQVWANVWQTDVILRIDPATGVVNASVDASGLLSPHPAEQNGDAVLNGIAYQPTTGTFFITGKLWPNIFEVAFVPA